MAANAIDKWCCKTCGRPAIDLDPYALDREITRLATIGDLMGGAAIPPVWRPLARRRWIRRLEERVLKELKTQHAFDVKIAILNGDS